MKALMRHPQKNQGPAQRYVPVQNRWAAMCNAAIIFSGQHFFRLRL
jgi:hypothetical protein